MNSKDTPSVSAEEAFEAFFRTNPAIMLLTDPETGTFVDANETACEFYGYIHEKFVTLKITELNTLDESSIQHELQMALAREQRVFNFKHRLSNGDLLDVESFTQPIELFGRQLILSTIFNVSEMAKAWRVQALLLEISEAANVTDDLYHLIYMIRDRLHGFLDTTNFYVSLYDVTTDSYTFPFSADEKTGDLPPPKLKGGLTDFVRRTGRSILVDDRLMEMLVKRGDVTRIGERSQQWLGVPLRTTRGVIGVVAIQHYTNPSAFDEADLEMLEFVSGAIAATIERRKAEEALRESEKRFRTFVHHSPDGLFSLDLDEPVSVDIPAQEQIDLIRAKAYFSECNETFFHTYSLSSASEVIGRRLHELPAVYDEERTTATVIRLVESGFRATEGESYETLPDGSERIFLNQYLGIVQDGYLVRIWGIQRDITERKHAEQQLQIQRTHLSRFIENSSEGIIFTDEGNRILNVNNEFERMFSYSKKELEGMSNELIVPGGKEEESKHLLRAARENKRVNIESVRRRKDGRLLYVSILGTPVFIDNKLYGIYWVYRDISQRKRAEKVQSALFHIAEAASTSSDLQELLSTVHDQLSHLIDIKNLYVALYDSVEKGYRFEYFEDELDDSVEIGKIYYMSDSMTEYVRTHGSHLFTTEEEILVHLKKYNIEPGGPVSKSWLGVPLRTPSGVIGVYVVQSYTKEYAYDENDMDLLEFVSGHVANAIEHTRWQDQLLASEARYRTLFNQSPVGVLLYDMDMQVTDLNQRHAEIMGSTREEIIGNDLTTIRQRNVIPLMRRALKGETTYYEGSYLATVSDRELWLSISMTPHYGAEGEIIGGIAVVMDQTEQKKTERIAEMNRAYLEQLFEGTPEAIVLLDPRFRAIRANKEFASLFGYTSDEVLGRSLKDLILTDDEEAEKHLSVLKAVAKGKTVNVEETVCRRRDGSRVDVSLLGTPIQIDGQVIALYGVYRDITARKQATEALAAEKDRLAVTLASIGEGVITTDLEGRVMLMNEAAERLTGWNAEEARQQDIATIFPLIELQTNKHLGSPAKRVLDGDRSTWTQESLLETRDLKVKNIIVSASKIHGHEERVIGSVVVFRDITEQRALEEELQKIERLESVGVLAGGIAHDFNNILSAVLGNISLAKMAVDNPGIQAERIHEAEKAALRARDLTQQLLTFSRGGEPIRKSQSIGELLQESATFALRGSNVRARIILPDDLWPANVDEGQISRVVNNLVINADQAMPEGGTVTIKASNFIMKKGMALPLSPGRYLQITIVDEGVGIPEEFLQRIFDPFFTTKQRGSGLGLASSFSIIQKHDGHITVESKVDSGTTFTIYLPATETVEAKRPETADGPFQGSGKILIMDDEASVRRVVKAMLEKIGFEVDEAENGIKAIETYQKARMAGEMYRAIIMDLTIPGGMGGGEAIQHLRKLDPKVKVIVSSGYSNDPVMSNYEQHGFKGVVAKPYRLEELIRVIRDVLGD
ncbi:MAG: PAS domain S-box protein [bacterium]